MSTPAAVSIEGDDAKTRTGVRDALTAWEWPAATIHPVKLAQWLLSSSIEKGCSLFTHCPVNQITRGESGTWSLHTSRGIVSADKVIHCTNAYAGSLLPQLSALLLTPIKVQMHSLIPNQAFSGGSVLKTSMALRYEEHRYYALTQMERDGTIIFGVAKPSGFTFDDSSYTDELIMEGLEKFGELFPESNSQKKRHGEGLDHAWSGLIAMTPDKVPYIGEIDGLDRQYICAGFNGHGMARIFGCVPGLVKLILGGNWQDMKLPESFRYSHERLSKAMGGAVA
jgi:glycine/D-amino acid oxidase-like deaminating enzyme